MFLTRKVGSFLRGKATPTQVFLAAFLAGILGFVPGFFLPGDLGGGFLQAPGLILGIVFLVLVLNANLGVFGLVTIVAKLCSLLLLPVSFALGRVLIDLLEPLFGTLVNAPVSAWFGLEYYATTGGLVIGACFGALAGFGLVRMLGAFRRRMAHVEQSSARYQEHAGRFWVRFLLWLLLGKGKGKKVSWQDLAEQQRGRPIRVAGVAVVAVVTAALFVFQGWFATPLLTSGVRSGLTAANGATVDLESAELDLASGSLQLTGLAMADPNDLARDLFAARGLEARLDTGALLRRRFVVDQLRASGAAAGSPRSTPGELVTRAPEPEPEPPSEVKTLEDYLKDFETWKERLAQVRDWLEWFSGGDEAPPEGRTPEDEQRRIEEAVRIHGMASVAADHLRKELPLVWIRAIDIEGIVCAWLEGEKLDLRGRNLSTDAWLLPEPVALNVATQGDRLRFAFTGPSRTTKGAALDLAMRGLPVDDVFGQFAIAGSPPLRGGTIDIATSGSLLTHGTQPTTVELPLRITLHQTTFALAGASETKVEQLVLPIGVHGPVTNPVIAVDDQTLATALAEAGKKELADFVRAQAGGLLGEHLPGAAPLLDGVQTPQDALDAARKAAEEAARKAAEDAAKKAADKQLEDAKKKATEGLRGILPGGRQ